MDVASQSRPRRLLLGGDLMMGRGVSQVLSDLGPGYPLDELRPVLCARDLFCANLECAITARHLRYWGPPKAFYFRAEPIAANALVEAGVRLVSLANNHALDADVAGLRDTLEILAEHGIAAVGAGENLELARSPVVVDLDGVRVGVLACCDHQSDFAAGSLQPGIWFVGLQDARERDRLLEAISALARQVDHVIVAVHWMSNWVPEPPPAYRKWAREMIEAGASILWGHSPHHFLGVEWIDSGLVLYSTGDLVDDYALEPTYRNDRQLLFEVSIGASGIQGVQAYPLELEYGRTRPAGDAARDWIHHRFERQCAALRSNVVAQSGWLSVFPSDAV